MSDSVRPHRWQPTRLPCPWGSPRKNPGVGCHFLLQCMKVKSESEVAQSCLTLRPYGQQPTRLLHPQDSLGKNIGVGCHFLLQCMKVKRESEVAQSCPTLRDPIDCSPPGSSVHGIFQARVLEWVATAFSLKVTTLSVSFVSAPAPSCKALAPFVPSSEQRSLISSWRAPLCPPLWGSTALAFYRQNHSLL